MFARQCDQSLEMKFLMHRDIDSYVEMRLLPNCHTWDQIWESQWHPDDYPICANWKYRA